MNRVFAFSTIAAFLVLTAMACTPEPSPEDRRIEETVAKLRDCADTRCERINLDRGDLPDFSVIAELDHVTALRMSWTDFDDLDDISAMTQLRELHISDTQISDLDGLALFQNLDILHLQWSRNIDDFSEISTLTGLKELALGGNDVGDMAFIGSLPDLEALSLRRSKFSSVEAFMDHPNLSRLDLEDTDLPEDLTPLLSLSKLSQVSVIMWRLSPEQIAVLDQLKARGVEVDEIWDAVIVDC